MGNGIFKEQAAPTREGLAGLLNDSIADGRLLAFEPLEMDDGNVIRLSRVRSIFTAQAKVLADTRNGNSYVLNPFHEAKSGIIISRLKRPTRHLRYGTQTGELSDIPYLEGELHPHTVYEDGQLRPDLSDITAVYETIFREVPRPLSIFFGSHYQSCTDLKDPLFREIINSTSVRRTVAAMLPLSYRTKSAAYPAD